MKSAKLFTTTQSNCPGLLTIQTRAIYSSPPQSFLGEGCTVEKS